MSDGEDKNANDGSKATLTLKSSGVSQGTVRQNFSHGRSKSVVVETRKRRITLPGETKPVISLKKNRGTIIFRKSASC